MADDEDRTADTGSAGYMTLRTATMIALVFSSLIALFDLVAAPMTFVPYFSLSVPLSEMSQVGEVNIVWMLLHATTSTLWKGAMTMFLAVLYFRQDPLKRR